MTEKIHKQTTINKELGQDEKNTSTITLLRRLWQIIVLQIKGCYISNSTNTISMLKDPASSHSTKYLKSYTMIMKNILIKW